MSTKPCSQCKEVKPLDLFPYDKRRNYYQTICKECKYAKVNRWHKENKDQVRECYGKYPSSRIYVRTCKITGKLFTTRVKNATTSKEGRVRKSRRIPRVTLDRLILRQSGCCALCNKPFTPDNKACTDHKIPVIAGGSDHISNLQAVHVRCNLIKGTKTSHRDINLLIQARVGKNSQTGRGRV